MSEALSRLLEEADWTPEELSAHPNAVIDRYMRVVLLCPDTLQLCSPAGCSGDLKTPGLTGLVSIVSAAEELKGLQ
ncbi:unnamed protein product [Merluccius merluccius]